MKNRVRILRKLMLGVILASLFITGCKSEVAENKTFPEKEPNHSVQSVISNSFFWGTWVRMDNGQQYEVLEDKVSFNRKEYKISSSSENELSVS